MNPADRTLYTGPREDGSLPYWRTPTLWKAAKDLPIIEVAIEELHVLDEVVWFGGHKDVKPTVRSVAEHARDMFNADLDCPIIINPAREIIDGAHRIAKAYLDGRHTLKAVILEEYPEPDGVISAAEINEHAPSTAILAQADHAAEFPEVS